MTRTYIIDADGERFVKVGTTRRLIGKAIGAAALIFTALFLAAAIIGLRHAAGIPDTTPTPSMHSTATRIPATNIATARRACRRAPKGAMQDCLALYLRGAWFDAHSFTPAGPALVKDCISQYRGAELADCFTQEIG